MEEEANRERELKGLPALPPRSPLAPAPMPCKGKRIDDSGEPLRRGGAFIEADGGGTKFTRPVVVETEQTSGAEEAVEEEGREVEIDLPAKIVIRGGKRKLVIELPDVDEEEEDDGKEVDEEKEQGRKRQKLAVRSAVLALLG